MDTLEADTSSRPAGEAATTAVVIGAGLGGIAAALRLRAKGYRVVLIERGPRIGGRAQVFEKDGFRHDAGPTVITAPFLFDELFELFGKRREDYVTFVPLDPWYRFRFNDGTTFDYGGTVEDTLAEIARFDPADCDGYLKLLEHSKKLFDAGFTELADRPFHDVRTMLAQVPKLAGLRADRTVWQLISHYLKHPKLRQAFSIQPLLVGGDPFETTSIYGLIHYLERQWGVFFAMGGTGALVAAMGRLMAEAGVEVRLETTVTSIRLDGRRVTGVELSDGSMIAAETVVSNADPLHLYQNMLPERVQPTSLKLKRRSRLSMGLYVLYFGTTRTYPDVAHHTIWFGPRYREHLADIFRRGILADDFSLYVHRPTATDPSFAPEGCESFYVLCPVPNTRAGIDWAVEGPKLEERIVSALDATMLPGLRQSRVASFAMTPDDFADRYLSVAGAGFSISPHFTQSAWFRFHNRSEAIRGLYLVGAGTHPGAGMPGVVCSAKVVDRLLPSVGATPKF
ncbi:MAG: phytoene desaturase family protein [Hyphomicrobiaceae bacterium]|nr:phytoene desaturase family protein [Hyphomicrobiaceae bacterium]